MKRSVVSVMLIASILALPVWAGDNMTAEEKAKVESIEVFQGAPDRAFDMLGTVTGEVCQRNSFTKSDEGRFKNADKLKLQAVRLGADAIIDTTCMKAAGTSFFKNCWAVLQCTGKAVKYR